MTRGTPASAPRPMPETRDAGDRSAPTSLGDRAPRILFYVGVAAVAALYLASALEYVLAIEYTLDDWDWLWWGQERERFLTLLSTNREMYRPVPWSLYAVFPRLFGLDPVPMGLFFLGVSASGAVLLALSLRAAGFAGPVAWFAAVLAWSAPATTTSLDLLALNETTLARASAAALWLLFLRRRAPPTWLWLPLYLVGFLCHEQFLVAPALLVLLLWYRDGWQGLRERWATSAAFRHLWFVHAALGLLRVWMYVQVPHDTHGLGTSTLGRNALFAWEQLSDVVSSMATDDGSVADLLGILATLVLIGVTLRRAPGVRARLPRVAVLSVAWAAVAFAPYLLARDYVTSYFMNQAIHGATLPLAVLLLGGLTEARIGAVGRAGVAAAAVLLFPWDLDLRERPYTATRILDVALPQIDPEGPPETRVVFVEASPAAPLATEPYQQREGISPYLASISAEWGSLALAVLHPGRTFPTEVIPERRLRFLCVHPDDVLVRVEERADARRSDRKWDFSALRPDPPRHAGLPPALRPGTAARRAAREDLMRGAANGSGRERARRTLDAAEAFCSARLDGDTRQTRRAARQTLRHASTLDTPAVDGLVAAVEAVWTPPQDDSGGS